MLYCEFCGEEIYIGALCITHSLEGKTETNFCNVCGEKIKNKISFIPKGSLKEIVLAYKCLACGFEYREEIPT